MRGKDRWKGDGRRNRRGSKEKGEEGSRQKRMGQRRKRDLSMAPTVPKVHYFKQVNLKFQARRQE